MTKATAIKLLEDLAATFDARYYQVTMATIAEIIAELEDPESDPSPQDCCP